MSQKRVTYKALGLYTFPNQFGAPEGAMSQATDCFIDRPGVVEAARAYNPTVGTGFPQATWINPVAYAGGTYSTPYVYASADYSAGTVTTTHLYGPRLLSTFEYLKLLTDATTATFTHDIQSSFSDRQYIFAATGGTLSADTQDYAAYASGCAAMYKIPTPGSAANTAEGDRVRSRGAGMPEAPGVSEYDGTTCGGITSLPNQVGGKTWGGASTATNYRAYRALFLRKDSIGTIVRGPPGGRIVIGALGVADFSICIFGIDRLYVGDIVQLYASEISASTTAEPSDDMRLVYEYIVTQPDITKKVIGVQDITPDSLRGAGLYTNDYLDGFALAEEAPPSAAFVSWFKNVAWYGGVYSKGYTSAVLGIIGLDSWANTTTTFTVNGNTYTAKTNEDVTARQFSLVTSGSASLNARTTAQSLCRCINYYDPSILALDATAPNATSVTVIIKYFGGAYNSAANPGTCTITTTAPAGTISPNGTITTTEPSKPNFVYYSKPDQSEAVPLLNYIQVGSPDFPVSGLAHVRDSLFVFKPDGLFRITGTTASSIRVDSFDETIRSYPWQYKTIATAGNQIFALCAQGIISITETGVALISRPIEDVMLAIGAQSYTPTQSTPVAVAGASDTERKYIFFYNIPNSGRIYVYNFVERTWTSPSPESQNNLASQVVVDTRAQTPDKIGFLNTRGTSKRWYYPGEGGTTYAATPTFKYCFTDQLNPGTLRRYKDIKITTLGSGALTSIACTFASDTSTSSSTVTVTPYNSVVTKVEVPKEYGLCSALYVTIAVTTGGNAMQISSVQTSYDEAGDWNAK